MAWGNLEWYRRRTEQAHTDEMDAPAGVGRRYLLLEDFCTVDGAAGGGHTSDEDFGAVCLEDLLDPAPVCDLHRCDGGANGDRVESEQAVTEHDRVFCGAVWREGKL